LEERCVIFQSRKEKKDPQKESFSVLEGPTRWKEAPALGEVPSKEKKQEPFQNSIIVAGAGKGRKKPVLQIRRGKGGREGKTKTVLNKTSTPRQKNEGGEGLKRRRSFRKRKGGQEDMQKSDDRRTLLARQAPCGDREERNGYYQNTTKNSEERTGLK